ncbi:MAG: TRAP transporter small permease [Cellulosilyticaceae bacterium]
MNTLRKYLNKVLEFVTVSLLAFMVVLGVWQILTRYLFNKPSVLTEELLIYSFVWMGLIGAAYVFGKREHMRMGFLVEKLNPTVQVYVSIITEFVVLVCAALVLIWGGINIVSLGMGQISPSLGIPMGYLYMALPLSGILTVIYNVLNMVDIMQTKGQSKSN